MPGRSSKTRRCSGCVNRDVMWIFGPWSDQTHRATQYIHQLRQFVQFCFAEEPSYSGHTLIISYGQSGTNLVSIDHHRAKFVDVKQLTLIPHSDCTIENWTRRIQLDRNPDQHKHR